MRAVFDTNIIIDYLSGKIASKQEIATFEEKIISIITYIEVLVGVENEADTVLVKQFLSLFEIVMVTQEIADLAVLTRKKYKLKVPDAIILATAEFKHALLVTRDIKDFPKDLPLLRVPY